LDKFIHLVDIQFKFKSKYQVQVQKLDVDSVSWLTSWVELELIKPDLIQHGSDGLYGCKVGDVLGRVQAV